LKGGAAKPEGFFQKENFQRRSCVRFVFRPPIPTSQPEVPNLLHGLGAFADPTGHVQQAIQARAVRLADSRPFHVEICLVLLRQKI